MLVTGGRPRLYTRLMQHPVNSTSFSRAPHLFTSISNIPVQCSVILCRLLTSQTTQMFINAATRTSNPAPQCTLIKHRYNTLTGHRAYDEDEVRRSRGNENKKGGVSNIILTP
jgi:hypothetical protein